MTTPLPAWISGLASPVWVRDPGGKVGYVNPEGERLLGWSASECIGHPCHRIVAGCDASGAVHCKPHCPLVSGALGGRPLGPVEIQVGRFQRWVTVICIPLRLSSHANPWLVHCAIDTQRAHRVESYLAKVASRSHQAAKGKSPGRDPLTEREREVLYLLSQDRDQRTVADTLNVSYVTVRNHVQHILGKLGVHSIIEAVALYILEVEQERLISDREEES